MEFVAKVHKPCLDCEKYLSHRIYNFHYQGENLMEMNPVVHFEMPAKDKGRMRKFYETAFGWQTEQLGKEMGEYVLVTTVERDEKTDLPRRLGAINGGFYQRTDDPPSQHPSIVIAVDDIKEAMKKVKEAGGKVLGGQVPGKPDDIPGVGLYASFIDTEGNRAGMLQPVPMQSNPKK
jgi:predicted enzyme related to lactoylglutathione lyase